MAAFAYGWTLFVVIATGTVAALAVATGTYVDQLIPIGATGRKIVAVAMIAVLCGINARGTRESARVLAVGTALKVSALLFLIIALPLAGSGFSQITTWWPERWTPGVIMAAGTAMISVLWAYEAWQYATFIAGEVVEPQRNFPRGLLAGTGVVIVVYVLGAIAYVAGLGPAALAGSAAPAADAVTANFGARAGRLITIPILVSIVSGAQAVILTNARVFFAMGRDGVFFQRMGEVHPRFGTPAFAIFAMGAWAAVLALSGQFNTLLTYVIFVGWIFYGLGGLALLVFRRTRPDAPRPFRVPGYPVAPLLFVASAAFIVVNTVITDPRKGLIGIGGALLAIPVFFLWRRPVRGRETGGGSRET
jgi:APA family basic amino acid/polyamine antiporter